MNVETSDFSDFDGAIMEIGPEHVMASCVLPPGLPPVRVGSEWFWDGGLVSSTPLQYLLEQEERDGLVVQVDLFQARGPFPRDMQRCWAREGHPLLLAHRMNTNAYTRLRRGQLVLKRALAKVPVEQLDDEERTLRRRLERLPRLLILQLSTS